MRRRQQRSTNGTMFPLFFYPDRSATGMVCGASPVQAILFLRYSWHAFCTVFNFLLPVPDKWFLGTKCIAHIPRYGNGPKIGTQDGLRTHVTIYPYAHLPMPIDSDSSDLPGVPGAPGHRWGVDRHDGALWTWKDFGWAVGCLCVQGMIQAPILHLVAPSHPLSFLAV